MQIVKIVKRADERGLSFTTRDEKFKEKEAIDILKHYNIKMVQPLLSKKGKMNSNGGN